ncbi:VOC family protein [Leifsonia sp. fls2-241-R2A-40a]|uniref:VOC family protein n=1 Tax=Leifsonia sp. fls2-241-R2A-40a TaxID=3040290 RepID=UPI00254BFFF7|nr:VOC family protein [Leifsonia sp. fls2-241-R2A-40a]
MTDNDGAGIVGVNTIGIPVVDQDRALAFYRDILGLEVRVDAPMPQVGGRWIMLGATGSPVTVSLVPAKDETPAGVETGIRFEASDADRAHAALVRGGGEVGEVLRWPGVPVMFAAHDPDGNRFEVVQTG